MISELTTHQKVSPKLGVKDVDSSGSRAQLTALEPLDSNVQLSLSLLPALTKESKLTQNAGLCSGARGINIFYTQLWTDFLVSCQF